ncbi:MAG TPA: carboxymuconolactone decarboxylase family protein [Polyangiales bacterium]
MTPTALSSEHGALPLVPIERPASWFVRLLYALTRKRYGLVPTAFRVVYARAPLMGLLSLVIVFAKSMLRLDPALAFMIPIAVAMRNGCTFCVDLTLAEAVRARIGPERFRDLLAYESSPAYTEREKSALRYVEALHTSLHIPDAVWSALEPHFSERERLEIVWLCAVERYFNALAIPLRIGTDHLADGR